MEQDKLEDDNTQLPEIKNAIWMNAEHTILDFMIHHKEYGWIPYTTSASDDGIGKQIWDIRDTLDIADYVPPSLGELKEQKLNELNSKASQFEQTENKDMFVTSSLGFKVNADPKAKRNIDTLIELQVPTFRDYDNVIHNDITVQDLETIKREISLNAVNLYNQKWTMESEINSLESVEDIENYEIKFEMLDFTK